MKRLVGGKAVEVRDGRPPASSADPAPAPLPYRWTFVPPPPSDGCPVYLIDATGRKIGAIWGKSGEKISTVKLIVDRCNGTQNRQDRDDDT